MGRITADFKSLFIHISWASSNATARHLSPFMFTVNPHSSKHFNI